MTIIEVKDLCFSYEDDAPALDHVSLSIKKGLSTGVLGGNGAGKSTLFLNLNGVLKPESGKILIEGKELGYSKKELLQARQKIGIVFQDPDDQLFSATVKEDVAFGPLNLGKSREEAMASARSTLDYLGLKGFEDRITYKLSGGEKRLVALATVLAMEPEVLLLDEPTNGLDDRTREILTHTLTRLDLSFILISHELDFVNQVTNTVFAMENGRILTDAEIHVHQHVHAHPYGSSAHKHS